MIERAILRLLSWIYGFGVRIRNLFYDKGLISSYSSSLPVVSIGNVTVGGSGKTPFAIYLAQGLLDRGEQPVILLRGYHGREKGPYLVKPEDSARMVGDEALLLARKFAGRLSVVIARRRVQGARYIERHKLGTVIVLDDGFQHRRLARLLNILIVDLNQQRREGNIYRQKLLPLGRLRELPGRALKRADCLLQIERSMRSFESFSHDTDCPQFGIRLVPSVFANAKTGEIKSKDYFAGKSVLAFTAIAQPDAFFKILSHGLGVKLEGLRAFQDHHFFTREELKRAFLNKKLPIIITEKDATKLEHQKLNTKHMWVMKVEISFVSSDEESKFWEMIEDYHVVKPKSSAPSLAVN